MLLSKPYFKREVGNHMIQFECVSKTYAGGQKALQDVNFHLGQGEMVFLTGHSGAGKSTLLKLICGIEKASTGHIWVNQYDLSQLTVKQMPFFRRRIGVIFQDCQLLMDKNIFDNVALPLVIEGYSQADMRRRVAAALDLVGLSGLDKYLPSMLSGGEQQRVGIARAVVNKPSLLLADEPTGNLDPELSHSIMNLFENFNQAGTTVLIATHDLKLIAGLGYRTLSLTSGRFKLNERLNTYASV
jgi:cell division transport system ATP-binding protein